MNFLRNWIDDDEEYKDKIIKRIPGLLFFCIAIMIIFMVVSAIASIFNSDFTFFGSIWKAFKVSGLIDIGIITIGLTYNIGVAKEWFDE